MNTDEHTCRNRKKGKVVVVAGTARDCADLFIEPQIDGS